MTPAAPLLAFDTSTPTARLAIVSADGACLAARAKTAARHSANLLGLTDEALREAGLSVGGLRAIACGAGPGSFTGLRGGLAVAKGLALPTGLPLVLVSSLEVLAGDLAEGLETPAVVLPCLDAGKGQVYAQVYDVAPGQAPRSRGEVDWAVTPAELASLGAAAAAGLPLRVGGGGLDRYLDVFRDALGSDSIRPAVAGPSATGVARLATQRLAWGQQDDLATAVPRYGRPPDITRPKGALPGCKRALPECKRTLPE
jgi:tRNA threonylcarbamoyladenosine biosynthesis protein TsaB